MRIQPKSEWQKKECLFCPNDAKLEVVQCTAAIRCCSNADCIDKAKRFAAKWWELFSV